uniref:Uncharacterized protein n=1 Tax=Trichobilharzia regenti TaxID=157069 RepID=A0AA85J540_TRIRE
MENLLLQALLCLIVILSNNNVTSDILMTEIQTHEKPQNAEQTMKREILRLEHLYQSKWAKEFLEYEYKKALEEDTAIDHNVFVHEGLYSMLNTSISSKWEIRKNLDITEGNYVAEKSGDLKKDEDRLHQYCIQYDDDKNMTFTFPDQQTEYHSTLLVYLAYLRVLERRAVIASIAYRNTANYLRTWDKEITTDGSSNDAEITEAYWKARTDLAEATLQLAKSIERLEIKRVEFLK